MTTLHSHRNHASPSHTQQASKPASKPATPSAILQRSRTNLIAASKERQRRRQASDWQDEKRERKGNLQIIDRRETENKVMVQ